MKPNSSIVISLLFYDCPITNMYFLGCSNHKSAISHSSSSKDPMYVNNSHTLHERRNSYAILMSCSKLKLVSITMVMEISNDNDLLDKFCPYFWWLGLETAHWQGSQDPGNDQDLTNGLAGSHSGTHKLNIQPRYLYA